MITLIGVLAMIMIVIHPVYSILRIIFRQHLHLSQSSIKLSVLGSSQELVYFLCPSMFMYHLTVFFAILAAVKYASHLHMLLWSRELRGQEFPVPEVHIKSRLLSLCVWLSIPVCQPTVQG